MTTYDPVEKNLKHKTDALTWEDIPWQRCDFNFRPPSLDHVAISYAGAYFRLLFIAAIGAVT